MAFSKKLIEQATIALERRCAAKRRADKIEKEVTLVDPRKERAKKSLRESLLRKAEHLIATSRSFPVAIRQLNAQRIKPTTRIIPTKAEQQRGEHYAARIDNRHTTKKQMVKHDKQRHVNLMWLSRMKYRDKFGLPKEERVIAPKKYRKKFRERVKPKHGDYIK